MSRLGESEPRPTHYENCFQRTLLTPRIPTRQAVHRAHEEVGRTPFRSTNGSTFDLVRYALTVADLHRLDSPNSDPAAPRTSHDILVTRCPVIDSFAGADLHGPSRPGVCDCSD